MTTNTIPASDLGDGMSLMEHLVELRSRVFKCAIAVAIGAIVGWLVYPAVFDILIEPLKELSKNPNVKDKLISLDPLEIFMLRVKMSAYIGLILAMPFLLWQLWQFIAPGLYQNERRYASAFVLSATLLFLLGASIAYFTLPEALKFLQSLGGDNIEYQYSPQKYLMLIIYMMVAFGAGFQFPIVVVFLQLVGIVTPKQLSSFRRFAIVIIFVVAAVITPSADPISLFALAIPMTIFYEISIVIGRLIHRSKAKAEAAA
ncbi:twin-arginine translocase subunit TatC [Aquihabitans sp. G128]|uniref:twin-arginine translocase subunit TatC n=1 Tax=Aquihabitans sp. G128 TaxID=2849779 RepID=UPI001C24BA37|nr:twin-arginine translocase subunit TatC [Aquihabitans sp. G128]QXC61940.1 twin-arginine translocase subunit TatC [Aquihabitans sp. G128]